MSREIVGWLLGELQKAYISRDYLKATQLISKLERATADDKLIWQMQGIFTEHIYGGESWVHGYLRMKGLL